LYPGMPGWPTQPSLEYEMINSVARDTYALTLITRMVTHTGTHLDAPAHFLSNGKTVDQLPFESYYGEGTVIDLSNKKAAEEITKEDLKKHELEIRKGEVLLIRTGWDKKFGSTPEFLFEWSYLGVESAKYLVSRKIKAVGIDGLSIGGWNETVPAHPPSAKSSPTETHKILLSANIVIIEVLANLDQVLEGRESRRGFFLFAPLNFVNAEGSPTRAVAIVQ
jgi:arylformamidase